MNRLIIALIVLSFFGCRHSDKDIICVNFRSVANCDKNGIPRDSFTYYFPPELFTDTILGFYDGKNIHCLKDISKTSYSKISGQKVETLKDTCEIKFDSLRLKINSYMLFKMNEPLLYSHYLNKDVYRLTTRSFGNRSPLVITIEKYKDSVVLISKKLNREICYPFIKVGGVILFYDPKFSLFNKKTNKYVITNKKKYDEELEKSREMTDSLSKIYNRCDYYLTANERRMISRITWDSIETMIDSVRFWKSKPQTDSNKYYIDGSTWILEGHSKYGYQIKVIHSPNFSSLNYKRHKLQYSYAMIFKYIMKQTNIKNE